jgi:AcrR family transcriptional regulator
MLDKPKGDRISRRRDLTRAEILRAAWEVCHEQGLAALALRELADRVGMRAPSLYSYFDSKEAIYDAMFAEGQRELLSLLGPDTGSPLSRAELYQQTRVFFDFCTADPTRYQLMFQRVVPGFSPSESSYRLALEVISLLDQRLRSAGVTNAADRDLWTAMITGLTDQQISNDPGGDRWGRLLPQVVDLFCDHVGIP